MALNLFQHHDRIPGALRRVDRIDVGLHVRLGPRLRPLLLGHGFGRQFGHPQLVPGPPAQQLFGHGK